MAKNIRDASMLASEITDPHNPKMPLSRPDLSQSIFGENAELQYEQGIPVFSNSLLTGQELMSGKEVVPVTNEFGQPVYRWQDIEQGKQGTMQDLMGPPTNVTTHDQWMALHQNLEDEMRAASEARDSLGHKLFTEREIDYIANKAARDTWGDRVDDKNLLTGTGALRQQAWAQEVKEDEAFAKDLKAAKDVIEGNTLYVNKIKEAEWPQYGRPSDTSRIFKQPQNFANALNLLYPVGDLAKTERKQIDGSTQKLVTKADIDLPFDTNKSVIESSAHNALVESAKTNASLRAFLPEYRDDKLYNKVSAEHYNRNSLRQYITQQNADEIAQDIWEAAVSLEKQKGYAGKSEHTMSREQYFIKIAEAIAEGDIQLFNIVPWVSFENRFEGADSDFVLNRINVSEKHRNSLAFGHDKKHKIEAEDLRIGDSNNRKGNVIRHIQYKGKKDFYDQISEVLNVRPATRENSIYAHSKEEAIKQADNKAREDKSPGLGMYYLTYMVPDASTGLYKRESRWYTTLYDRLEDAAAKKNLSEIELLNKERRLKYLKDVRARGIDQARVNDAILKDPGAQDPGAPLGEVKMIHTAPEPYHWGYEPTDMSFSR